ncbi:MAG: hypothetical protein H0W92_04455, partial [Sphingomonas sp.]|nr:hypothetical protein [Sphingomonas sp.]
NGVSILADIAEAARAGGWEIDGLAVEAGRLDEVFRTITAHYQDDTFIPEGRDGPRADPAAP